MSLHTINVYLKIKTKKVNSLALEDSLDALVNDADMAAQAVGRAEGALTHPTRKFLYRLQDKRTAH